MKRTIILMFMVTLCASVSFAQGLVGSVQADGKTIVEAAELEGTIETNVLPSTAVYTDKENTFTENQNFTSLLLSDTLSMASNAVNAVSGMTFATNSTQIFTGTLLGTNYVAFIDGTNVYRIKFVY